MSISPRKLSARPGFRGALALCQDVFAELPRSPIWQHVLLADGNIGLGGNPVRLLTRIARLLDSQGTVLVELTGPGELSIHDVRLRVGDRTTRSFSWATVGTAAIGEVAAAAGLGRRRGAKHVQPARGHAPPPTGDESNRPAADRAPMTTYQPLGVDLG